MKVGFIGSGNMASAIARGWADAMREGAEGAPTGLAFADADAERAKRTADELGGELAADNATLAASVDLVVLGVKPPHLDDVAPDVRGAGKPVLSLLAATPLERLRQALPGVPVIRLLPNMPAEVRRGVICWAASEEVDADLRHRVRSLASLLGTELELADGLMNAATAVMSSSPAYVALFAEALIDAGIHEGLHADQAKLMVLETLAGTAALMEDRDSLEVRRMVTSPGGTTAAGLAALEDGSVRSALAEAVRASMERMRE